VPISPPTGYTGGGLNERVYPGIGLAIDGSGNVWVADWNEYGAGVIVSEFSSSGVAISPSTGYLGGAGSPATSIAVDASGNVWVGSNASGTGQGLTVFVGAAAPVVTPLALAVKNNKLGQRP
jgi:sugar lactone lactonase YvrE